MLPRALVCPIGYREVVFSASSCGLCDSSPCAITLATGDPLETSGRGVQNASLEILCYDTVQQFS